MAADSWEEEPRNSSVHLAPLCVLRTIELTVLLTPRTFMIRFFKTSRNSSISSARTSVTMSNSPVTSYSSSILSSLDRPGLRRPCEATRRRCQRTPIEEPLVNYPPRTGAGRRWAIYRFLDPASLFTGSRQQDSSSFHYSDKPGRKDIGETVLDLCKSALRYWTRSAKIGRAHV